ncbi:MAG: hypothetical protein ACI870_000482 [Crocinitomicaceae bacterium]|jgi:hypothetical protein
MNDPLRDNRIFPEEMHEKPVVNKKHSHFSWVWISVVSIIIILIAIGYFYINKNTKIRETQNEYEKQVETINAVQRSHFEISSGERDQKIDLLLGN